MKFKAAKPIILASTSPRRKELLQMIGIPFQTVPSHVSEDIEMIGTDFGAYARELATKKAQAVSKDYGSSLIIGADTIVVFDEKMYTKPESEEQATQFLKELSGKTHFVITGVAMYSDDQISSFSVETRVTFRKLDDALIAEYVRSGDPMDKAGAYGIQTAGALLVEKIEGDYYSVMGLPISKLTEHLRTQAYLSLGEGDANSDN
ncbi:Maf family protein [Filibacter tadaridae]|uniref:dTTP/UTP pyrophosphatase n=1 Tax=Filibacter tadaridae TaxID=2483811 RepID=A0A3P5XCP8_9BACL|nr:Maf family protein [Filibacter tadaridae]VDC32616.1 Septum formation protein Maf [Filibacter tadaridae]